MIEYKTTIYRGGLLVNEDIYHVSDRYYINNYSFEDFYNRKNKVMIRRNIMNDNIGIFLKCKYK